MSKTEMMSVLMRQACSGHKKGDRVTVGSTVGRDWLHRGVAVELDAQGNPIESPAAQREGPGSRSGDGDGEGDGDEGDGGGSGEDEEDPGGGGRSEDNVL